MSLFFGTLIIVGLCCLAMGLGQVIEGKPLSGGCGNKPKGVPRCESCPEQSILTLADLFINGRFHRYPVVDNGRLVGVISRRDVMQAMGKYYPANPQ